MAQSSSHLKEKATPWLKRHAAPDTLAKEVAEDLRPWPSVVAGLLDHMRTCIELRNFGRGVARDKTNADSPRGTIWVARDSVLLPERDASRAKASKRIEEAYFKCLEQCSAPSKIAATLLGHHMAPPVSMTERIECRMSRCDPLAQRARVFLSDGIPCIWHEGEWSEVQRKFPTRERSSDL